MAKGNNAPAPAGATSNEVEGVQVEAVQVEEVQVEAVQVEDVQVEDVQVEEVHSEEVQSEEVKVEAVKSDSPVEEVNEVSVVSPEVFIAEDGTELEFAVHHFICPDGKKYTVAQAIAEAPEVLEVLYKANSFIFKK